MKKNILFTAFNLDIGGVEKCLVNLVNALDDEKYRVKIILQVKEGVYLNDLNENIIVEGYNLIKIKNKILKKIINIIKYIYILIKNYRKYDYSICYAPGYTPSSILALLASKNNIAWMHTNLDIYMKNYKPYENKKWTVNKKIKRFVNKMFFRKFKRNVFVSKDALNAYLKVFPKDKKKCEVIYNIIDYNNIIKKSKETISLKKNKEFTFINIGRQTEFDKRLSRIIKASKKLKEDGYKFKCILVGSGTDTSLYKSLINKYKLNNYITLIENKKNPYPYFLLGDVFILSSEFEGFPTTIMEALTLKIPIISTNVSDLEELINNKYGIVVEKNDESIYNSMLDFINKKYAISNNFDASKFNKKELKKIERLLNDEKF